MIEAGNHNAIGHGLDPIRGWHPLEVLHFSLRSLAQVEQKAVRDWRGWSRNEHGPTLHHVLAHEAHRDGRLDEYYESFVVTDEELERGLAEGRLAVDTRLRDTLRSLRDGSGGVLAAPHPDIESDAAYAAEASILVEIDGIVRAGRRVDALEDRLAALERGPLSRLTRRDRQHRPRRETGGGARGSPRRARTGAAFAPQSRLARR